MLWNSPESNSVIFLWSSSVSFFSPITLLQPLCSPASVSANSCVLSLLPSPQVPALLIIIKVPYQIQKSVIVLDGLLYNRFLFNLSNTDVVVPEEEKKTRNHRALAFYLFLTYGAVHAEVSFCLWRLFFLGIFHFYQQICTMWDFHQEIIPRKEAMRQFYLSDL